MHKIVVLIAVAILGFQLGSIGTQKVQFSSDEGVESDARNLSASKARFQASEFGVKPENSAAQNSAALAAAFTVLGARGGGEIDLLCGTYQFTRIIDDVPGVLLVGPAAMAPHDSGKASYCTRLVANETVGSFYVLKTPYGRNLSEYEGGGFENIMLDGNGQAPRLLEVDSVSRATLKGYLYNAVGGTGGQAAWFHSGRSRLDLAEAADVQGSHIDLVCRQLDGTLAQATDCFKLDGSRNANFSYNFDVHLRCERARGNCVNGYNADNNTMEIADGGSTNNGGYGLFAYAFSAGDEGDPSGFRDNKITHYGGGQVYEQGTNDPGVIAPTYNEIVLDHDNSAPVPQHGTGSHWYGDFTQTYIPHVTCSTGTLTTASNAASYVDHPSREIDVRFRFDVLGTNGCAGLSFSLPYSADANVESLGVAEEIRMTGKLYSALVRRGSNTLALGEVLAGRYVVPLRDWSIATQVTYAAGR